MVLNNNKLIFYRCFYYKILFNLFKKRFTLLKVIEIIIFVKVIIKNTKEIIIFGKVIIKKNKEIINYNKENSTIYKENNNYKKGIINNRKKNLLM